MICATKAVGDWTHVRDVPDPKELFREMCSCECRVLDLHSNAPGLSALTHNEPDIDAGINLEVSGTLLYGSIVFVNVVEGELTSLTDSQLDLLSRYVNLGRPLVKEGGGNVGG